ncbi:phosphatidylserine decarboxylase [Candidatus Cetobacterium colombiensis]|jgi:phosphatidylserine decarboxylase|uniref:Phosphatidylserine decarboxylase proenzyme n=1 Tax=Candidatus Cetobacterium colombiensis TaxID=3073100 RepID=A0ABU4WA65_9FUSO|nr:phosphatidylserine decarboxylase [Candidatus Cetobacterium colombiensis]MDX8335305.1 phosphatidylserine decarboxylase [Candidatus Cetobacterium colombiensis]
MNFDKINYIERKTGEIKTENPPGEGFLKFLYYNPLGKLPLNLIVRKKFLTEYYGKKMSCKSSIEKIKPFVNENFINMEESKKKIEEFTSFNDFFVRELKDGAREIAQGDEILVSPADGKILVFENLKDTTKFFLKGDEFTLEEFLMDKEEAKKFQGGTIVIIRLAPVDYHRFHFPADGEIGESKLIDGYYYSVSPYAIKKNFRIYCENKREVSILKTKKFGEIVLSEIGATMVGGIKQTYTPKTFVKKGDEKGYFFFGGSSCVLLFEKDKVNFDKDILENSQKGIETKVYMGEKIGEAK